MIHTFDILLSVPGPIIIYNFEISDLVSEGYSKIVFTAILISDHHSARFLKPTRGTQI